MTPPRGKRLIGGPLTVSTLCFGTGYMGGSIPAGARMLTRVYDLGVTVGRLRNASARGAGR